MSNLSLQLEELGRENLCQRKDEEEGESEEADHRGREGEDEQYSHKYFLHYSPFLIKILSLLVFS